MFARSDLPVVTWPRSQRVSHDFLTEESVLEFYKGNSKKAQEAMEAAEQEGRRGLLIFEFRQSKRTRAHQQGCLNMKLPLIL